MNQVRIYTPLKEKVLFTLRAGQEVLLTGKMYTARDAAHMRIVRMLELQEPLPFDLKDQIIYYAAPTPAPPGKVIGSCGPTSSYRMDDLTCPLLRAGVKATVGKGQRSPKIRELMCRYKAVYFLTLAGGGAYLSARIKKARIVAFEELGPEAVHELEVVDFPLIVGIDTQGEDIYEKIGDRKAPL